MLTVAAIWYLCDQNEPSNPFLLELDIPEKPTKEELEKALIDIYTPTMMVPDEDDDDKTIERITNNKAIVSNKGYGDLQVEDEYCKEQYLIIGLPEALKYLIKEFKQ